MSCQEIFFLSEYGLIYMICKMNITIYIAIDLLEYHYYHGIRAISCVYKLEKR